MPGHRHQAQGGRHRAAQPEAGGGELGFLAVAFEVSVIEFLQVENATWVIRVENRFDDTSGAQKTLEFREIGPEFVFPRHPWSAVLTKNVKGMPELLQNFGEW